jgi:membrane associated rhomboid family serine protease
MHLFFNMFTLYFFGPLAERFYANAVGPLAYPLFYLAAIVIAILPTYMRHRQDASYRSLGRRVRSRRCCSPTSCSTRGE